MPTSLRLWSVFFVALAVIGLETVTFQALSFVTEYLLATGVLSIALLGVSLGGVLAWIWPKGGTTAILAAFPVSVLASFPVVMWVNDRPSLLMALLTVPYVLASWFISRMFAELPPSRVYLYDLVGAAISGVVVFLAIPQLREEGSFFLLGLIGSIPLLLHGVSSVPARVLGAASAIGCATLLGLHLTSDPFNMLRLATADREEFGAKLFNNWITSEGEERYDLLHSRGSLIERIDIVAKKGDRKKGPWTSIYNGRPVDSITSNKSKLGLLDNRMPTRMKEDPDTLLVGPSGQGLCKAVQALGDGHIDAVEINGAIAGLMAGPMFKKSGEAYGGMDLAVTDVRTFLERTERRYDYITLLNTHRIWSMGHQGPPEYVHTIEAMDAYFSHLKDDGYVLFEERNINQQAELGIRRLIHTAKAALVARGAEHPEDHFLVWELYHGCPPTTWFSTPDDPGRKCNRGKLFTFVMVKNSPVTEAEVAHLESWAKELGDRKPGTSGDYRGIIWRHLPLRDTYHRWSDVVRAQTLEEVGDVDASKHRLGVITDDVPYPYDVFLERPSLDTLLKTTVGLALVMVLIPGGLAFVGTRQGGASAPVTALLVAFFAVLGLAYMLVEVVLIQKFGIFLSSPAVSFVVVLGGMLLFSGIGGHVSATFTRGRILGAMSGVLAFVVAATLGVDTVLDVLLALPFALRVVAAVLLVAPLAFAMGMPFPHVMAWTKDHLGPAHAGLMFAVNGALAAIAAPLSLRLSMDLGFDRTLLIGGGLYATCVVLLAMLPTGAAASASETTEGTGKTEAA